MLAASGSTSSEAAGGGGGGFPKRLHVGQRKHAQLQGQPLGLKKTAHKRAGWPQQQRAGRAELRDFAIIEQQNAVGQLESFLHVVGHEHHRFAA